MKMKYTKDEKSIYYMYIYFTLLLSNVQKVHFDLEVQAR